MEIRIIEGQETSTLTVGAVIQAEPNPADVVVENHGSLFTFRFCTPAGREWVEENLIGEEEDIPSHMWLGSHTLAVEHRYARDLAAGMQADGLKVV